MCRTWLASNLIWLPCMFHTSDSWFQQEIIKNKPYACTYRGGGSMQRTIRRERCNVHSHQWQLGKYSKVWQSGRGSPLWIPTFPVLLAFIHPKLQTGALVLFLTLGSYIQTFFFYHQLCVYCWLRWLCKFKREVLCTLWVTNQVVVNSVHCTCAASVVLVIHNDHN